VTTTREARRPRTKVQQAFRLDTAGLGTRVVRGAGYQFLNMAVRTLTTVGSIAVLARLLSPADFGYVAMATVITEFAAMFANFGLANVLIQRRKVSRLQLDTVFWASLALGAILSAMVFVASFLVGWLFEEAIVGKLLRILCVSFLLGSLVTIPWAILSRLMYFRALFVVGTLSKTAGAIASVLLAYAGFGVWSLALGGITGATVNVLSVFAMVPYLPRFRFDAEHLRTTWKTSSSYFAGGILYYINTNIDLLLVGRYLGPTSLGFYQNARSLTNEIRARIATPLQHVLFPAFSSLQDDAERLRDVVVRSGRLLAAVVVPIGFGVSATASELVPVLYGEKWIEMIPVMSMFGLSAALRASTAIASPLFNSQNRVALGLRYTAVYTLLLIGGILVSLDAGVKGIAIAVAVTSLYSLVTLHGAFRLVGLRVRDMGHVLGAPFAAAGCMWTLIHLLRLYTSEWLKMSEWTAFVLHVAFGVIVYVMILLLLSRNHLSDLRAVLQKAVQGDPQTRTGGDQKSVTPSDISSG